MSDQETTLHDMRERVAAFIHERDWEQFHNAKDLAAAIAIEAAELMEIFLWMGPADIEAVPQDPTTRQRTLDELADVMILCLSLANRLQIDLSTAIIAKMAANAAKYPAELARGKSDKYTRYAQPAEESPTRNSGREIGGITLAD